MSKLFIPIILLLTISFVYANSSQQSNNSTLYDEQIKLIIAQSDSYEAQSLTQSQIQSKFVDFAQTNKIDYNALIEFNRSFRNAKNLFKQQSEHKVSNPVTQQHQKNNTSINDQTKPNKINQEANKQNENNLDAKSKSVGKDNRMPNNFENRNNTNFEHKGLDSNQTFHNETDRNGPFQGKFNQQEKPKQNDTNFSKVDAGQKTQNKSSAQGSL